MSLYQKIKSFPQEGSLKKLFNELKCGEGYELLEKLDCTANELVLVAKYTVESIDPESPLHDTFKVRRDLKRAILKDYKIDEKNKFWESIINNDNDQYTEFAKWYYRQIQDYYAQAINACKDVIEQQLDASTIRIGKYQADENGNTKIEDDKYFKAMNIQNTCLNNAIDNISKLEQLQNIRLKKYERTDEAVSEEIYKNSGSAEQSAIYAKRLKDK